MNLAVGNLGILLGDQSVTLIDRGRYIKWVMYVSAYVRMYESIVGSVKTQLK